MTKIVEIRFYAVQSENVQALDVKVFNLQYHGENDPIYWPMNERIIIMWEKGWNLKIKILEIHF